MRVSWNSRRGLVVLSATIMVLQGAGYANAQFAPYGNQNQNYGQNQNQAYGQNQGYGQKQVYGQGQAYGQNQNRAYAQPQAGPQYTAMAYQGVEAPGAQPATLPAPVAAQNQNGGHGTPTGPACNSCQPAPATNYPQAAYPQPQAAPTQAPYQSGYGGYNAGGSGYNTFGNAVAGGYGHGGHGGSLLGVRRGGRRWFGGYYGLWMERSGNDRVPLGFTTTTPGVGYYPTDMEVALTTQSVDAGYQGGAEIRFGSTFGDGGGCGPAWGWEVAYWGLVEETETARIDDMATFATDGNRTYSMIDFRGLEVNMGSGYRPVNSYFDYAPPVADHTNDPGFVGVDVEIRSLVARSTFSTQSVEVNLLRLPMFGSSGSCSTGSCDTGGCSGGSCGSGAVARGLGGAGGLRGRGSFAPFSGPRHSMTTLAGFRFMRFDEDFSLRSNVDLVDGTGTTVGSEFIAYNIEADNQLYGFQLGCNGIYRLGCRGRWALQYGTSFGIYGNRMNVSQRMDIPSTGIATRYVNGAQSNFDVNSSKDDVAFLGELRVGGSYQYSQNWRLYGGWRALAVSGVALTTSQIPTAFITPGQVGNINSNGSLFLHGLQAGVEYTY